MQQVDIKGFEGLYQITEDGRVWSIRSCRFLKLTYNGRGYLKVHLSDGVNLYNKYVHRLVAQAFCPNDDPKNKTQVNHKDENKSNNVASNLEWCTNDYNHKYGTCGRRAVQHQLETLLRTGKIDMRTKQPDYKKNARKRLGSRIYTDGISFAFWRNVCRFPKEEKAKWSEVVDSCELLRAEEWFKEQERKRQEEIEAKVALMYPSRQRRWRYRHTKMTNGKEVITRMALDKRIKKEKADPNDWTELIENNIENE